MYVSTSDLPSSANGLPDEIDDKLPNSYFFKESKMYLAEKLNGLELPQTQSHTNGRITPHCQREIVLSIHPKYSEKIFGGHKTVELRRRFPVSLSKDVVVYVYSTSPVSAIVGCAEIASVEKLPVSDVWRQYRKVASIEKIDFDAYFSGIDEGTVLKFSNVRPFPRAADLHELRKRFGFCPPRSFMYATPDMQRALKLEYAEVSS